jgi:purine-binding chemotaxis protein CheW
MIADQLNCKQTGNKMEAAAQIFNKSLACTGNPSAQDAQPCLAIQLQGEIYALAILSIREIVEYGNIVILSGQPDFIRGGFNYRGVMLPVVDPGLRFNKCSLHVWHQPCIAIISVANGSASHDIGLIGDWVSGMPVTHGVEGEPLFLGGNISFDFMDSEGRISGKSVIPLSLDQFLSTGASIVFPD